MIFAKIVPLKAWFLVVLLLLAITGCASPRERTAALVRNAGWHWDIITTNRFDLATAQPWEQQGQTLWVYIEGDGFAYRTPTSPSSDPTPSDPVALRLALAHPVSDAVAYLARPCQYVLPEQGRNCRPLYWTIGRYASEVVDSINQAVDILKDQAGATHVVLVGYSGGGALAVLTASRRKDVIGIVTVAANLNLAYWTKRDGLTPLTDSLDPSSVTSAVATIPQVHFTGLRDEAVGSDVVQSFVRRMPSDAPVLIVEIPNFSHTCCWASEWARLITRPDVVSTLHRAISPF